MDRTVEQELIARCLKGEAAAWDLLFDTHYGASGRFVFQTAPDLSAEDVEEICQETFLSVVKNLGTFNRGSQLQTWIFRIAGNKARDYREKKRATKRGGGVTPISLNAEDPETGLTLDVATPLPGPDAILASRELQGGLIEALNTLGEQCREVIELRYFGDLSYDEIAAAVGTNPKTVSSRLSKCLDRLEAAARVIFSRDNGGVFPSNNQDARGVTTTGGA